MKLPTTDFEQIPSTPADCARTSKRHLSCAVGRARYIGAILLLLALGPSIAEAFVAFETAHVRPLAVSSDQSRLYMVNTPDNRLEIFDIGESGLSHRVSVPVGLEPVAVALRGNDEAWIVNHLSDSVSVVDLSVMPPRVVRTLLVGDEPRDIVFAGPSFDRAFITTAHRGQNSPYIDAADPGEMMTAGIGRADVWVFDANSLGSALGGSPLTIVTLFGDTPRALAASPDGQTVYAAVFQSGNKTTTINERLVCDGGELVAPCQPVPTELFAPGGVPGPNVNGDGVAGPESGLIVKHDGEHWVDAIGRIWDTMVRFDLPDKDVFVIDAMANPPAETLAVAGVGTVLFNMTVNPKSGVLYVSNTQANNDQRFEGTRPSGDDTSSLIGHLHEARITVVDGSNATPLHLNKHIDYSQVPAPQQVRENSLSQPQGMAITADGSTLFVAAFGSNKIGKFDTTELESDVFTPSSGDHVIVSGGGPSGLVLDETRGRLYVATRFDNGLSVVDLAAGTEIAHYGLPNPEPQEIVDGRPFLYDANLTSSNGESACASCHVSADLDSLAWNLGNPLGQAVANPNPGFNFFPASVLHPLKGPMATQSMRGLANHGPMHWRGDRTVGGQPDGDPLDELEAFKSFNVAFAGLLGREGPLADSEMQAFADFVLQIVYPPNPIKSLDNSLNSAQQAGRDIFFNGVAVDESYSGAIPCAHCHNVDATQGQFGTAGLTAFAAGPQDFKVPHLRNLYQKIGMFGMPENSSFFDVDNSHTGDQIRGFGYSHDGSRDTLLRHLSDIIFTSQVQDNRFEIAQYLLAFDTDLAPIVGQQITLSSTSTTATNNRIDLLLERADAPFVSQVLGGDVTEADIVVKGIIGGEQRGWTRLPDGTFRSDRAAESPWTEVALRDLADTASQELTFTAAVPGEGYRMGIDRDEDGFLDGDDVCRAVSDASQADIDADGIGDACDNCIEVANPDQRDTNADGFGNVCDADLDNDRSINFSDLLLMRQVFFGSDADADLNGDGNVDFADLQLMRNAFFGAPGPSAASSQP